MTNVEKMVKVLEVIGTYMIGGLVCSPADLYVIKVGNCNEYFDTLINDNYTPIERKIHKKFSAALICVQLGAEIDSVELTRAYLERFNKMWCYLYRASRRNIPEYMIFDYISKLYEQSVFD